MKKLVVISLSVLLHFGVLWQMGYTAWFYANQVEIAELFCVNKDKPQLQCNGQCHLKKELNNVTADESNQAPAPNKIEVKLPLFWLDNDLFDLLPVGETKQVAYPLLLSVQYLFNWVGGDIKPPEGFM